jgi:hypothetical protein
VQHFPQPVPDDFHGISPEVIVCILPDGISATMACL